MAPEASVSPQVTSDDTPYDRYKLREAYRAGWRAWARERALPDEFFDENVEQVYR